MNSAKIKTLTENKKSASRSNQEQETDKATNRQKRVEGQLISVGVETGEDAGRKPPIKKGVILTRKKVYRPPLTSIYKETELSEELNDGTEWVLRD